MRNINHSPDHYYTRLTPIEKSGLGYQCQAPNLGAPSDANVMTNRSSKMSIKIALSVTTKLEAIQCLLSSIVQPEWRIFFKRIGMTEKPLRIECEGVWKNTWVFVRFPHAYAHMGAFRNKIMSVRD